MERIVDAELDRIERDHGAGLTSAAILEIFAAHRIKLSEATLRKYVQLGLLPRSVRVGRKGKHKGSQGMYPATVVRQIQRIKEMMARSYTIEQIQREFLFVRGDIEALERTLAGIFDALRNAARNNRSETTARAVTSELAAAEANAKQLVHRLEGIEQRLTAQARVERVVAS